MESDGLDSLKGLLCVVLVHAVQIKLGSPEIAELTVSRRLAAEVDNLFRVRISMEAILVSLVVNVGELAIQDLTTLALDLQKALPHITAIDAWIARLDPAQNLCRLRRTIFADERSLVIDGVRGTLGRTKDVAERSRIQAIHLFARTDVTCGGHCIWIPVCPAGPRPGSIFSQRKN